MVIAPTSFFILHGDSTNFIFILHGDSTNFIFILYGDYTNLFWFTIILGLLNPHH